MRSAVLAVAPFAALVFAAASGCSSSKAPASAGPGGNDGGAADSGSLTTASFDMAATVPAGGEMFKCKYVQLPDVPAFLVAAKHDYTPGSHHMLLLTTSLTSIPAGGDQVTDCYEGNGSNIMSSARGVLYGGQTPTGAEQYPAGIGLPTNASQVLIFQVHYLNASASDLAASVHAELTLDTNAADIAQRAGIIFFYDPFIHVPAGATAKAAMRCPIPSDITLMYASSHYHSRGVGYGAYLDTASGLAAQPFYTSSSWSSPDNATLSMAIPAGSRLRFECDYDNSSGTQEFFSGQSAQTSEMCMFIGTYYPEMGQPADFCFQDQDMMGTGTAACGATLSCMQACGGQVALGGFEISPPPCEQTCMVASCPTASAPLVAFSSCMSASCQTECSDPSSSACASCITANCSSQYLACQSHACN